MRVPENKQLPKFFKIASAFYLGFATESVKDIFFSRVISLRGRHNTISRATGWTALHPEA